MSHAVVVDASLAAAWVLPEPWSDAALRQAERWTADNFALIAPALFAAELTNALFKRVRRRELSLPAAREALTIVGAFGIELREEPGTPDRAMALAAEHDRPSVYDCCYLALAESADAEFWTGDERFYNAVSAREARVRWIGAARG